MTSNTAISTSEDDTFNSVMENISNGLRSMFEIPGQGFIHLEPELPFLFLHRIKPNDAGTKRLAKSGASYLIIGDVSAFEYGKLITQVSEAMTSKHNAFLIVDIYSGSYGSTDFKIHAPESRLPASMEALKHELHKIRVSDEAPYLGVTVDNEVVAVEGVSVLPCSSDEVLDCGATLIHIEVPPVYRSSQGVLFPVFFRRFRDHFSRALQKAIFEFIRVQTTSGIPSFSAIGKRNIHEELYKLDKQLTDIESSFSLLMLVAPVNINNIRETFFESGFKEVPDYHYRLLPVDPDRLKRKLFNLRIDEIDDPALAFLYSEKREELDKQLSMLKERGSRNFFYSSIRLFHGVEKDLKKEAENILSILPEEQEPDPSELINAFQFKELVQQEFNFFKKQDSGFQSKVHIKEDLNVMMVSQGEFYLPKNYKLTHKEANALLQHEIGTHVLTYYNGSKQPLSQLKAGLADYDTLQEGLAVMSEFLSGSITPNRLRTLAGRVVAGDALMQGCNFKDMFDLLKNTYGFSKDRAFNIVSRMFQGGGFLKDIIYLKGFVQLRHYLNSGGDLELLLSGKFALHHVNIIQELIERQVLIAPVIKPRYLQMDCYKDQMKETTAGTYLAQMIKK
ncbi:flavohemoglobin expression-modulating QEGLA motif protein [Nonlabens antarcticus]|uniref:flavohemoglobin expression-modulating QEGLA motif protein n=1 Tax=Nonlabens antarcticus TaxID=392714 RepID=UPI00189175EE|nr:tyrosine/phenylalanine carboxypeptidase domain-containing protein [Nonlabens antarcticus]